MCTNCMYVHPSLELVKGDLSIGVTFDHGNVYIPYSGKLWQALYLTKSFPDGIGMNKISHIEHICHIPLLCHHLYVKTWQLRELTQKHRFCNYYNIDDFKFGVQQICQSARLKPSSKFPAVWYVGHTYVCVQQSRLLCEDSSTHRH